MLPEPVREESSERLERTTKLAIAASFVFFVGLFLAGTVVRVPAAVLAEGSLRIADTAIVSHSRGGTIDSIEVAEGDVVREGQTLIVLESVASASQTDTARLNRDELLARKARIEAQLSGRSEIDDSRLDGGPGLAAALRRERAVLRNSASERAQQRGLLGQEIALKERTLGDLDSQMAANREQARLIQDELEGLRDLFQRGLLTKSRLNAVERTAIQLDAAQASLESARSQTRAGIASLRRDLVTFDSSRREAAQNELLAITRDLSEQTNRFTAAREEQDSSTITAPVAGRVNDLVYKTVGSAVPPGVAMLTIVPVNDRRRVVAFVRPGDVDLVEASQEIRMVLGTSGNTSRMEITGTIDVVGSESMTDPDTGREQFEVLIQLDGKAQETVSSLRSGTPIEVFFISRSRSLLNYLVQPIIDQLKRAMVR